MLESTGSLREKGAVVGQGVGQLLEFPGMGKQIPGIHTIGHALNIFEQDMAAHWEPRTRKVFGYIKRDWIDFFETRTIESLSKVDVKQLSIFEASQGKSAFWHNRKRQVFLIFLKWLQSQELIQWSFSQDLWKRQPEPEKEDGAFIALSEEKENRLCGFLSLPLLKYIQVQIRTALRRQCICDLKVSHIEIQEDGWLLNVPPKLMKQRRGFNIPLCGKLQKLLSPLGNPEDPLIPNLPHPNAINRDLKLAAHKAGINWQKFNTTQLRVTAVDRLLKRGRSLEAIMKLFGWSTASIVYKHYLKRGDLKERREMVEQI